MLTVLLSGVALLIAFPLTVLAIECFCALLPPRRQEPGERTACAVLIPAHNEESGLGGTIDNVKSQLDPGDRLVVVADNCTDRTAEIARRHGAETVDRNDGTRRGKGFALEAGMLYMKRSERGIPSVVVILDADCRFAPGAIDHLVRVTHAQGRPFQARYLMRAPASAGAAKRVSEFAFLVKNWVRPRGLERLRLPVPLTGSGMAFPKEIAERLELGTKEIVEDLKLGLDLVLSGERPGFCEGAHVESEFPDSDAASKQQRTRWEHGYLGQMKEMLPRLLAKGLTGRPLALASFVDLVVPPLSLLVMATMVIVSLLIGDYLIRGVSVPLCLVGASVGSAAFGLATCWLRFGRDSLSAADVMYIPAYAARKLSIYLAVPFQSEREWKRTERAK